MELILPSLALKKTFIGTDAFTKKVTLKNVSSYHAFRIGNIGLLLLHNTISEVAVNLDFCQIPNTSQILHGMANLRGNIIPIFDLHVQLNITINQANNRKILVVGEGKSAAAILIDELPVRLTFSPQDRCSEITSLPSELQQYVNNGYQAREGMWYEIDMESLFYALSKYI